MFQKSRPNDPNEKNSISLYDTVREELKILLLFLGFSVDRNGHCSTMCFTYICDSLWIVSFMLLVANEQSIYFLVSIYCVSCSFK